MLLLLLFLRKISKFLVWAAVTTLKREDVKGSLTKKTPSDATHSQGQWGMGSTLGKEYEV